MIKEIVFKKLDTLDEELLVINFSPKINIIIGPKGGGKSTLFDLLATISKGYISKNTIEALKEFKLGFVQAIKTNNEIIHINQLDKKSKKDTLLNFKQRNDVIFQDDPIKKDINNSEEINKQKSEYVHDLVKSSMTIEKFINSINDFYKNMSDISIMNQNQDLNWSNSFQINSKNNNKDLLIVKLAYKNITINSLIKEEENNLKEVIKNSKEQIIYLGKMKNKKFNTIYQDDLFKNNYLDSLNNLIKEHNKLLENLELREKFINHIKLIINCFNKSYKKTIDEIKAKDFNGDGLKAYETNAKIYFRDFAKIIIKQKENFETLINKEVKLIFDTQSMVSDTKLLTYKIDSEVTLESDEIIDILKIVLFTPTSQSDISKWLIELIKNGVKDFNKDKILKMIEKYLIKNVKVFAEGKNYENMSLGEKSIYGIKYKFNKSLDQILFLDQPEDNLDNYTIATKILDLLSQKKQQVFIVTHNANIGILSNPEKIIIADLNDQDKQYYEADLISTEELKSVHFLEGGLSSLEKRYFKVKGEK